MIPESQEQLKQLWAFFAHRLRREEWKQQAVISFGKNDHTLHQTEDTNKSPDGGGIRRIRQPPDTSRSYEQNWRSGEKSRWARGRV